MKASFTIFGAVAFVAFATGCAGDIRIVSKTLSGGTVALQGKESEARQKADRYMRARCPQGYTIVEEGEAVIGSTSSGYISGGRGFATSTTSSRDKTEWRLKYECNAGDEEGSLHELVIVY